MASIEEGGDDLPCSLVLVEGESGRVVGHARLMQVAGREKAALVETGTYTGETLWCWLLLILFICSVGRASAERKGAGTKTDACR